MEVNNRGTAPSEEPNNNGNTEKKGSHLGRQFRKITKTLGKLFEKKVKPNEKEDLTQEDMSPPEGILNEVLNRVFESSPFFMGEFEIKESTTYSGGSILEITNKEDDELYRLINTNDESVIKSGDYVVIKLIDVESIDKNSGQRSFTDKYCVVKLEENYVHKDEQIIAFTTSESNKPLYGRKEEDSKICDGSIRFGLGCDNYVVYQPLER